MNKLLAATCLVAFAALADGQAVWRFEKADADAAGGPDAAAKTQKKTRGQTPRNARFSGISAIPTL